jgi:PhnB protein
LDTTDEFRSPATSSAQSIGPTPEETQMDFRPYLAFAGNCREAFTRYQQIFGGELNVLTFADMPDGEEQAPPNRPADAVMHAALTAGDALLMGADDPSGQFSGAVNGMCVNYAGPDAGDAKRVFDALAEGGEVQLPISETFFSPAFGMCRDRFGIPWMVMAEMTADAG